jgi:hypothetical protein
VTEEMVEERFGLDALQFAEQLNLRVGGRLAGNTLAKINERIRVPVPARDECGTRRSDVPGFEMRGGANGDFGKGGVIPGPPEPVSGVGEIRLAPMNNRVEKAAIGGLDLLRDDMRRIHVIVPEQHDAADEIAGIGGQRQAKKDGFEYFTQPCLRQDVRPRSGAKLWQAGGSEQLAKVSGLGFGSHNGGNLGPVGASFNGLLNHFHPVFGEQNARRLVHKAHR